MAMLTRKHAASETLDSRERKRPPTPSGRAIIPVLLDLASGSASTAALKRCSHGAKSRAPSTCSIVTLLFPPSPPLIRLSSARAVGERGK